MKKLLYTLLFLSLSQTSYADNKNVLFIGNSYTYYNNLPDVINSIANSFGDTLVYDQSTPGGMTAMGHWNNATTKTKIQQGGWDFVSIQCQSQEPSFSPGQVLNDTYPYIKSLDSLIQASNSCAATMYFMTWGRKNGDQANCPLYPPICTYDGMQQRLRESYLMFADSTNGSVSPVGAAWKVFRSQYPNIELYSPDESHPSLQGSYLAACVFYSSIFHKSSSGSTYIPGGITSTEATYIQDIASALVLDSLEFWQGNGSIPKAEYSVSNSTNNYTFTNSSLRANSYEWDFGDGSAISTMTNPTHSFTNAGTYQVCLKAISSCGKVSEKCSLLQVGALSVSELDEENFKIAVQNRKIHFINYEFNASYSIYSLNGTVFKTGKCTEEPIDLSNLPLGYYVLSLRNPKGQIQNKPFVLN